MALVKQASLGGCQAHVKERSISEACFNTLIDENREGEELSVFETFFVVVVVVIGFFGGVQQPLLC